MINDMKFIHLRNIYYRFIKSNRYPLWKTKETSYEKSSIN